mgnify:CR=1 FL=1
MDAEPIPDFDHDSQSSLLGDDEHDQNAADPQELMPWREYQHLTGLYVSYLDLVVKASVGVVFIVATVTTLVLANAEERPEIVWSLLPLALLCGGISWVAVKSINLAQELRARVRVLASQLEIGLAPHVEVLIYGARGAAVLAGSTAVLLLALTALLQLT